MKRNTKKSVQTMYRLLRLSLGGLIALAFYLYSHQAYRPPAVAIVLNGISLTFWVVWNCHTPEKRSPNNAKAAGLRDGRR